MPNRYRYNGKELNDELGLNWYDYGFRWYDPAVARFVSVDPLAEEFPELTTYQYASNTPIWAIDLDGLEALKVTGDPEALEKFKNAVDSYGGGFIKTNIDSETGLVSISSTSKEGKPSERQQNFIDEMNGLTIEGSQEFEVGIVQSSEEVLIGSYASERVDIDDVEQFGDGEFTSAAGALTHELVEQKDKQVNGTKTFTASHHKGIDAENRVNGTNRAYKNLREDLDTFGIPDLPATGTVEYGVTKQDGDKIFPIRKKVKVHIQKGNVTNVKTLDRE